MTNEQKRRLLDYKARQEAGEKLPCPRCGANTMRSVLHTNALSRHADIMICPDCGQTEALDDFFGIGTSIGEWAFMSDLPSGTYLLRFAHLDSEASCEEQEFAAEDSAWEAFSLFSEKASTDTYAGITLIRREWNGKRESTIAELRFPHET